LSQEKPQGEVVIAKGRAGPLRRYHPWVYAGAIAEVRGRPEPGDIVDVVDHRGNFLARGYYNPHSQIRVRVLSTIAERIDEDFWAERLRQAAEARSRLFRITDAVRLVNSESDGIPGLIVDRYGDFLSFQVLTYGIEVRKHLLAELMAGLFSPAGIYERSDVGVRALEGLEPAKGRVFGEEPPPKLEIREGRAKFHVDIRSGHKTGFYLDQRENRLLLEEISHGKEVLDVFSYTGGFGVHAGLGGAKSVLFIEESAKNLRWAREHLVLNRLSELKAGFVAGNAFQELRRLYRERRQFDLVILDPPKFARNAAEVKDALRGYKDINILGMRLLRRGGYLLTFSCSGHVTEELFLKALIAAASDVRREAKILRRLHQAEDHPVGLTFPEGAYLKGFLIQVF